MKMFLILSCFLFMPTEWAKCQSQFCGITSRIMKAFANVAIQGITPLLVQMKKRGRLVYSMIQHYLVESRKRPSKFPQATDKSTRDNQWS